jgi:hypothetical protein
MHLVKIYLVLLSAVTVFTTTISYILNFNRTIQVLVISLVVDL